MKRVKKYIIKMIYLMIKKNYYNDVSSLILLNVYFLFVLHKFKIIGIIILKAQNPDNIIKIKLFSTHVNMYIINEPTFLSNVNSP